MNIYIQIYIYIPPHTDIHKYIHNYTNNYSMGENTKMQGQIIEKYNINEVQLNII